MTTSTQQQHKQQVSAKMSSQTSTSDAATLPLDLIAKNAASALGVIQRAVASAPEGKKRVQQKLQLFESSQVLLTVTLSCTHPKGSTLLLTLPNPVYCPMTDSGCLITKDLPSAPKDYEATAVHYADLLRRASCHEGLTVLPLRELTVAYMPFEAKRRLCNAYDYFLADRRIAHRLGNKLGSHFLNKNRRKLPMPVDLEARDLSAEISTARRTSRVCLTGTTVSCLVGQIDSSGGGSEADTNKSILANVSAACDQLGKRLGSGVITGLYLRHPTCGNIPLFISAAAAKPDGSSNADELSESKTVIAAGNGELKAKIRDFDKDLAELGETLWDKDLLLAKKRQVKKATLKRKAVDTGAPLAAGQRRSHLPPRAKKVKRGRKAVKK